MLPVRPQGSDSVNQPDPLVRFGRWIMDHLYNHNPFYVLSAALVLFGINALFQDHDALAHPNALSFDSWFQLGLIAGYALLLAATGILIVRLGSVWDDARTILLTIVLLFVAMSVGFDKLVLTSAATFYQVLSVGLVFAIGLSEVVLRGLRIRLPILFRGPFYLFLGLFFLYPIVLSHLLDGAGPSDPRGMLERTLWGIFLFPSVTAVATLTLLPAVWRGPQYVTENGTPWRWPLFPWSLFVILAVAIMLRSYYFTISFHPFPGPTSAFGVYFLIPLLASICLILFELGRSVGRIFIEHLALLAPLPLLWLALPGRHHAPAFEQVLEIVMARIGSPVLLCWWCLVALYLFAWLRGNRLAESGLGVLLVAGSVLGPATVDARSFQFPAVAPLLMASAFFAWVALRRTSSSFRWLVAASSAIGTSTVALWETPFVTLGGVGPLHLFMAAVLLIGFAFDDGFARVCRRIGSVMLVVFSAASVGAFHWGEFPTVVVLAHGYVLLLASWLSWQHWRTRSDLTVAVIVSCMWLTEFGILVMNVLLRLANPMGVLAMVGGTLSFLIAFAISLGKAGVWRRQKGVGSRQ
jgi:hypothetical protein